MDQSPINQSSEDNVKHLRSCLRFRKPMAPVYNYDMESAIVYLRLRAEGCEKRKAACFTSRQLCRTDSTVKVAGPSSCRILKPKIDSKFAISGGWQSSIAQKYEMGSQFQCSAEDAVGATGMNAQLAERLSVNENKVKDDFRSKIKQLTEFYNELNQKHDYSNYQKPQLHNKLKELQAQAFKFKTAPRKFLETDSLQFFELVQDFEENKAISENPLSQLEAFPFVLPTDLEVSSKPPHQLFQCRMEQKKNNSSTNPQASEDEIKKRTAQIKQLVNDSQFVISITQNQDLSDSHSKQLMANQLSNYGVAQNPQKTQIAKEFNLSNYVSPPTQLEVNPQQGSYQSGQVIKKKPSMDENKQNRNRISSIGIDDVHFAKLDHLKKKKSTSQRHISSSDLESGPTTSKSINTIKEMELQKQKQERAAGWNHFRQKLNGFVSEQLNKVNQKVDPEERNKIDSDNFNYQIMTERFNFAQEKRMKSLTQHHSRSSPRFRLPEKNQSLLPTSFTQRTLVSTVAPKSRSGSSHQLISRNNLQGSAQEPTSNNLQVSSTIHISEKKMFSSKRNASLFSLHNIQSITKL